MSDPPLLPSAASGMTGWLVGSLPCMKRRGRVTGWGTALVGARCPAGVRKSGRMALHEMA